MAAAGECAEPDAGRVAALQALERAERALTVRPRDQSILCGRGTCLVRLGRLDEAEASYRESLAISPQHVATLVNYAVLLEESRGKSAQACDLYKRALELEPGNVHALSNYAHTLCKRGNYAKAEVLMKKSLRLDPSDVTVMHNYGCLLWESRKDFKKAEEILSQVLALDPSHEASVQALVELRQDRARAEHEAAQHARALLAELDVSDSGQAEGDGFGLGPDAQINLGTKKARRRKKKKGAADAAVPEEDDSQHQPENPAGPLPLEDSGPPAQIEAHPKEPLEEEKLFGHGHPAAPAVRFTDSKGTQQRIHSHPSSPARNGRAVRDDGAPGPGQDVHSAQASAPRNIPGSSCTREWADVEMGALSDPSSPLLASLLASSPLPPLSKRGEAAGAQPPKTPSAMRSWLLSLSSSMPIDDKLIASSDEEEEHLIDDHGIMHVTSSAGKEEGLTGSPASHTLIYSNWRDRREGDSAPLMGGEKGESIQRSVAEAAAAAREREAMERDAKRKEEAKIFEIREEKDELLASRECCVCLEAVKSCVLRPCLHMCVCSDCAQELLDGHGLCPLCRHPVEETLEVFL